MLKRVCKRAWRGIGNWVLFFIIVPLFILRMAILWALWIVLGPLTFFAFIFGSIFIRGDDDAKARWGQAMLDSLESLMDGLGAIGDSVIDGIDKVFGRDPAFEKEQTAD